MAPTQQHLNVYSGPRALEKYFDPGEQPMLPLVELPAKLNPLLEHGVHIYAKMLTALPAQNVKALPALNMLQNAPGSEKKPVLEASSGSTVISLALASRVVNQNDDVTAYVTNKTEKSRLQTLAFFGLKVCLYGGPAQPEISDERGIINKIRRWAVEDDDVVLRVCNRTGDSIPGPRPAPLFESVSFPWKSVVDAVEEIDSVQSYRLSMLLSRQGLICGPSSGMALQALLDFLERTKDEGRLGEYAGPDGQVFAVFPCCDLPYQYMDNYFKKLDASHFHPIANSHLLEIDTHPYNTAWELEAPVAVELLHHPPGAKLAANGTAPSKIKIIDMRAPEDFCKGTLAGAKNVMFDSVRADSPSPFDDVAVLESQWTEMEARLSGDANHDVINGGSKVITICYNGESALVLTSILRARGVEAYSIKGGIASLKTLAVVA